MKSRALKFTKAASRDLDEVLKDFEAIDNQVAVEFKHKLDSALENLVMFPERCPFVKDESIKDTRILIFPDYNYLVFYKFSKEKNNISIRRIIYGKRQYEHLL